MLFYSKRHFTLKHDDGTSTLEHTVILDTIVISLLVCCCHEIGHLAKHAYSSAHSSCSCQRTLLDLSKPTSKTSSNFPDSAQCNISLAMIKDVFPKINDSLV